MRRPAPLREAISFPIGALDEVQKETGL
jgi:hypothetical protein